jgi:hypothetical protein
MKEKMKKILITLMVALLSVPTFAQRDKSLLDRDVYFGLRFGLNLSNISGDLTSNMGTSPGLLIGGVLGLSISESNPICIETGLFYSERGGQKGDYEYNLNYLEVPVLLKYGFEISDELLITPLAGPYFSLGVSGTQKEYERSRVSSFGSPDVGTPESPIDPGKPGNNKFNRWDMGFKLGCGAEFKSLYLEVGAQLGMSNIHKNPDGALVELTRHGNAFYMQIGINL